MKNWKLNFKNWEYTVSIFIGLYFILINFVFEFSEVENLKNHLRVVPNEVIQHFNVDISSNNNFAYIQYSTNYQYLNLALINCITLRKSETIAKSLVVLFDKNLEFEDIAKFNRLRDISAQYDITLKPVEVLAVSKSSSTDWAKSFTKFHVFNQDEFDRIIYFDSDSMFVNVDMADSNTGDLLRNLPGNFDELFKLPNEFDLILPHAYWLTKEEHKRSKKVEVPNEKRYNLKIGKLISDIENNGDKNIWQFLPSLFSEDQKFKNRDHFFANHVMVLSPSKETFKQIKKYIYNPLLWLLTNRSKLRKVSDFDMEIMNRFIDDKFKQHSDFKVGILPHKNYGVLTGEFREFWHARFIAEPQYLPYSKRKTNDNWYPLKTLSKIRSVHFSDAPIPKPWEFEDNYDHYNIFKIYCFDSSFNEEEYKRSYPSEWKPRLTDDCASVQIWNWIREEFSKTMQLYWVV
ncbi:uncharacterized protein PRCAT00000257001 [Priceomyces carsonii]|uniref:uncharacterized protein n=1 Tax=Priceomyces carsonii TaxID=28549 RepID=UPI002ED9AAFF|nr:unnamed protein product [Priceomyces carsonii]